VELRSCGRCESCDGWEEAVTGEEDGRVDHIFRTLLGGNHFIVDSCRVMRMLAA
jgi:hypothetical protein